MATAEFELLTSLTEITKTTWAPLGTSLVGDRVEQNPSVHGGDFFKKRDDGELQTLQPRSINDAMRPIKSQRQRISWSSSSVLPGSSISTMRAWTAIVLKVMWRAFEATILILNNKLISYIQSLLFDWFFIFLKVQTLVRQFNCVTSK